MTLAAVSMLLALFVFVVSGGSLRRKGQLSTGAYRAMVGVAGLAFLVFALLALQTMWSRG